MLSAIDVGLVARRDDRGDVGPGAGAGALGAGEERVVALRAAPEEAPADQQIEPDRQRGDGDKLGAHWR